MYDLMFFICILFVFILAYGVVAQALRFPNSNATYKLFIDVIYLPYWQIYGELFLDELEGMACSSYFFNKTSLLLW